MLKLRLRQNDTMTDLKLPEQPKPGDIFRIADALFQKIPNRDDAWVDKSAVRTSDNDITYPVDPVTHRKWNLMDQSLTVSDADEKTRVELLAVNEKGEETILQSFAPAYGLFYTGSGPDRRTLPTDSDYRIDNARFHFTAKPEKYTSYDQFLSLAAEGKIARADITSYAILPYLAKDRDELYPDGMNPHGRGHITESLYRRDFFPSFEAAEKADDPVLTEKDTVLISDGFYEGMKAREEAVDAKKADVTVWVDRANPEQPVFVTAGTFQREEAKDFGNITRQTGKTKDEVIEDYLPVTVQVTPRDLLPNQWQYERISNAIGLPKSELPAYLGISCTIGNEEPKAIGRKLAEAYGREYPVEELNVGDLRKAFSKMDCLDLEDLDEIHDYVNNCRDELGRLRKGDTAFDLSFQIPGEIEKMYQEEEEMER